ncbi:hypothetical protein T484DRAFT_1894648 [Baffinella frigidus]|nr:hypothetical protein T484DRAFT_1894648 [Cryptophyta sp. CCMP2293]
MWLSHQVSAAVILKGLGVRAASDAAWHEMEEKYVDKGFVVDPNGDPLTRPLQPVSQILSTPPPPKPTIVSPERLSSGKKSGGRSLAFKDDSNTVCFFPYNEYESDAPAPPPFAGWRAALDREEEEALADVAADEEVRRNTSVNAGSAFSFC